MASRVWTRSFNIALFFRMLQHLQRSVVPYLITNAPSYRVLTRRRLRPMPMMPLAVTRGGPDQY
jgi:hypothetical protein